MGKTTLVTNFTYRAVQQGVSCLVFTLDESENSLGCKVLGMSTMTPTNLIEAGFHRNGKFDREAFESAAKRFSEKADMINRMIIRDDTFDILQIEAEVRRLKKKKIFVLLPKKRA